jgi:hypothetical protein
MNESLETLFLYSSTSELSLELKKRLERSKSKGGSGMKCVCVDNEKVRKFITEQTFTTATRKKMGVTTIPCILVRLKGGVHEIISGPEILEILKSGGASSPSTPTSVPTPTQKNSSPFTH